MISGGNRCLEYEILLILRHYLAPAAGHDVSVTGPFHTHTQDENERKYQKALRIAERLAVMGCSSQDNLPYFNATDHLAA
jgi:hypothetical protein